MNRYRFGISRKELKKGSRGPPGKGFKLTDDGNYDMEKKKLKNVDEPVDISDVTTKSYVDLNRIELKSHIVELQKRSLIHSEHGDFDAKGKIIGNVKDPIHDMNVVNRQYLKNNALTLSQTNTLLPEDFFDLKGIPLKHLPNPQDKNDAATKQYVDKKTKINDKKPDNNLTRDHDGLYVPKTSTFLATNKEQQIGIDNDMASLIEFNVFSSTLLTTELQLTTDMLMKITIFLKFDRFIYNDNYMLYINLNDDIIYSEDLVKGNFLFAYGKRDDKLKISIMRKFSIKPTIFYVKPYLYIEKISEFDL